MPVPCNHWGSGGGCSFAPSLAVLCYKGDKEERAELKNDTQHTPFNVLLTTYEVRVNGCIYTQYILYVITLQPLLPRCNIQPLFLFPDMSERLFILEKVSFC